MLYGHPASLSCLASGFPQPQITWFKKDTLGNSLPVRLDHRVKQLQNGTLFYGVTQVLDGGLYHCEASFHSEIPTLRSDSVELQIRSNFSFNTFDSIVYSQYYKYDQRRSKDQSEI